MGDEDIREEVRIYTLPLYSWQAWAYIASTEQKEGDQRRVDPTPESMATAPNWCRSLSLSLFFP